jgi:hypothetical protein
MNLEPIYKVAVESLPTVQPVSFWKGQIPNVINGIAAIGALGAALASWRTLGLMRKDKEQERKNSVPVLQFNGGTGSILLNGTKNNLFLELLYANTRKNPIFSTRHIAFLFDKEDKLFTYYMLERNGNGEVRDSFSFGVRLPPENIYIHGIWKAIVFIEVMDPYGNTCHEVCHLGFNLTDYQTPSDQIAMFQIGPKVYGFLFNDFIPQDSKYIIRDYLKNFTDTKWLDFAKKFKRYYHVPFWHWR